MIKIIPQWKPTEEQSKFLQEKKKQYGTVTGYIKSLIAKEMEKENEQR